MSETRLEKLYGADIVNLDFVHYKIHDGIMWSLSYFTKDHTTSSHIDLLIKTPTASSVHAAFSVAVGGASDIFLIENPTCSSDTVTSFGTTLTSYNYNRNITGSCTVGIYLGPNTPSGGSTIASDHITGSSNKNNLIGANARTNTEWVLKKDTKYWIRLTNASGSTITSAISAEFYLGD